MDLKTIREKLLALDSKKAVRFIILFGSKSQGVATPLSDTDIAVYYEGTPQERFDFRVHASGELPREVDVHIFQDLPLPMQKEVLTGTPLYYDHFSFMCNQYLKVVKEFSAFEKYYNGYLEEMAQGVVA